MRLLLLLLSLAIIPACADTGCDFREGSVNGPEDRCQVRSGMQALSFDFACEAAGGVVVAGG